MVHLKFADDRPCCTLVGVERTHIREVRGKKLNLCHECKAAVIRDDQRRMLLLRKANLTEAQQTELQRTWDNY